MNDIYYLNNRVRASGQELILRIIVKKLLLFLGKVSFKISVPPDDKSYDIIGKYFRYRLCFSGSEFTFNLKEIY